MALEFALILNSQSHNTRRNRQLVREQRPPLAGLSPEKFPNASEGYQIDDSSSICQRPANGRMRQDSAGTTSRSNRSMLARS